MRRRGDLLAFADDMLLMSNSRTEGEEIVNELASLEVSYQSPPEQEEVGDSDGGGPGGDWRCEM